jgi:hypothetical protein
MQNTWITLDNSPASGALTIRLRKLRTTDHRTRGSERKTQGWVKNLMIVLFCLCASDVTPFNTKLVKRIFGKIVTLYWSRSRSTRSAETTKKAARLSRL